MLRGTALSLKLDESPHIPRCVWIFVAALLNMDVERVGLMVRAIICLVRLLAHRPLSAVRFVYRAVMLARRGSRNLGDKISTRILAPWEAKCDGAGAANTAFRRQVTTVTFSASLF